MVWRLKEPIAGRRMKIFKRRPREINIDDPIEYINIFEENNCFEEDGNNKNEGFDEKNQENV